jgi:hypothetical protein
MDSASVSAPNNPVAPMHMRLAVSGAQEQTPYQSQLKASRICTKIVRSWSAGSSLGDHVTSASSPLLRCVPATNPVVRGQPGRPDGLGGSLLMVEAPRCVAIEDQRQPPPRWGV